ncbi:phage portal protein [Paraburkholderia terrae]|uniref:phage portal protein n=1 Tax=Paraburkholderia terrae TaxID=311230 RepID=UPI00206DD04D|nr:phage portal protein [Paraburkholderia terrae]BDC37742.1 hypothetical protein PTKU15_10390 [Paraburkholderia terrae]
MSAHAYIQWADVPHELISSSGQIIDSETQAKLVAFDGCPFCGEITENGDKALRVEYAFPRNHELRNSLVDWFIHHGISFVVLAS